MKCRHGITGPCPQCKGAVERGDILLEVARLVMELSDSAGLDASRLAALLSSAGAKQR